MSQAPLWLGLCVLQALDEYASLDKLRLNSPPAFFTGIIRRIAKGLPPPSGRPDRMPPVLPIMPA